MTERFLRYVVIDTQSDPASPTCPSTEMQKDLGRLLARELQAMGLSDAHLDEHGYVYATIPANTGKPVPVICFCSHMDTSPDCTGKNVKPQIVRKYRGGDIALPADCVVTDDAGAVTDYQIVADPAMCAEGQHLRLALGGAPHGATVVSCTNP